MPPSPTVRQSTARPGAGGSGPHPRPEPFRRPTAGGAPGKRRSRHAGRSDRRRRPPRRKAPAPPSAGPLGWGWPAPRRPPSSPVRWLRQRWASNRRLRQPSRRPLSRWFARLHHVSLTGDPSAGEIAIHPGWDSTDGQLPQGPADSDEGDSTDVRPDRRSYPQLPDLSQGLY
jgi:hypothetical protein